MIKNFSVNNSSAGQTSNNNGFTTIIINDPASYLKKSKDQNEVRKDENDLEQLDEIDREVIFSSAL